MPRPSGQERARIQTERRKARDAQRAAAAAEAAKKPKPIYNRRGRIVGYKDPVLEPEKAESQKPQGGQGTKPGSSKDDTARKITNSPPRQSEPPLKYPQDLGRLLEGKNGIGQDMIKFSALEYKPVGNSLISPSGKASERFLEPNGSQKSLIDIYLPIPQDINSANTAGWSDKDFSAVYAALYRVSKGAGEIGAGDNTVDGVRQEVATALQESGLMGKEGLDLITTKVGSAAANALTGANVGLDDILSRQAGVIVNPNKELLFNSVSLREFGFSFVFTARSQDEANEIKKIIHAFKKYSAPKTGSTGFFLASPDVFQISYLHRGNEPHPFLNRFKVAALKSVNVNYTGSSTYSTYTDGTPTHIIMSLSFSEIEPVYYEDFMDEKGMLGTGY
tara:strand:+ start:130 stop:1302 length:1173 start_codon:yes stop_codon:yes gene_type:complete